MSKINFILVVLLMFSLAIADNVIAGNMNKNGGGAVLTAEEADGLLFMREEEKLARDVYLAMWERWGLQEFENIAASEQQHMDAVLYLLGKYGLEDPALDRGVFENQDLQQLYDDLLAQGEVSLVDAIKVGIIIEETDIADITDYLTQTDKKDITTVYNNLLDGSYNHLAAFESLLPSAE